MCLNFHSSLACSLACSRPATATRKSDSGNVSRIDLSNTSIVFFSLSLLFFFFFIPIRPARRSSTCCDFCYLPRLLRHHHRPIIRNTRHRYFSRDISPMPPSSFFLTRENIYPRSVFRLVNRPRLVFSRPSSPLFLRPRFRSSTTREQAIVKPGSNN